MKILVTGATGFIGERLCNRLISDGHQLVIAARNPKKTRERLHFPAGSFRMDPLKANTNFRIMAATPLCILPASRSLEAGGPPIAKSGSCDRVSKELRAFCTIEQSSERPSVFIPLRQ